MSGNEAILTALVVILFIGLWLVTRLMDKRHERCNRWINSMSARIASLEVERTERKARVVQSRERLSAVHRPAVPVEPANSIGFDIHKD